MTNNNNHLKTEVSELPPCDICSQSGKNTPAKYDALLNLGGWGNVCETHFRQFGTGLGLGKGQELILTKGETTTPRKLMGAMGIPVINN